MRVLCNVKYSTDRVSTQAILSVSWAFLSPDNKLILANGTDIDLISVETIDKRLYETFLKYLLDDGFVDLTDWDIEFRQITEKDRRMKESDVK